MSTEGGDLLQELIKGQMLKDLVWFVGELFVIAENDRQAKDTDLDYLLMRDGGNHENGRLNAITPQPKKGSQWYFSDLNSEPWLSLEFSRSQLLKYTSAWALLQTS